jgi:putative ABC transport system ATP-binding protein
MIGFILQTFNLINMITVQKNVGAFMNNPTTILADEPTVKPDTKTGDELFDLLKLLSRKFTRRIVMVTHYDKLAERTDMSIYIRDGRVEKEVTN